MMAPSHPNTCTCREHPVPASMRVRDALDAYLHENGFTKESYDSPKSTGSFLGLKFSVPNPPSHQRAIRLHDLHHVATGFGTDHAGEGEISAWQARRGLLVAGPYVTAIVITSALLGMAFAPRRTWRALRAAGPGASLFGTTIDYDALLESTVMDLRRLLNIPRAGLAASRRGLHAQAPLYSEQVRKPA